MLNTVLTAAPVYLLVAVRCFAMLMTLPLFSMRSIPRMAKIALAGYMACMVVPIVYGGDLSVSQYVLAREVYSGRFSMQYIMLLVGEGMIGVILGFYISIIFAAFSSAGQFFSFQMGFTAAEAFDALSQVENPLMGQYLNLVAMLAFLQNRGFQLVFLKGLLKSFEAINAYDLVYCKERFMQFLLKGLSQLFLDGFIIAFPFIGILFLISVTLGLLSKAAPQMNLLSEGLPLTISISFILMYSLLPVMIDCFGTIFTGGIESIANLLSSLTKAVSP